MMNRTELPIWRMQHRCSGSFDRCKLGRFLPGGQDAREGRARSGAFQGLPACVRIPLGKGVCGTSAQLRETVLVPDVHAFPGHIACDAASQSEIVIPIVRGDVLIGVLDIDSPSLNRFDELDQRYLEQFVQALASAM